MSQRISYLMKKQINVVGAIIVKNGKIYVHNVAMIKVWQAFGNFQAARLKAVKRLFKH